MAQFVDNVNSVTGGQFTKIVQGSNLSADSVDVISQSGRSVKIIVENAGIAIIDTEILESIPDAKSYLLCKTTITGDDLITEIKSNPGENYYLYAYDAVVDENFPYGTELIVSMTKDEAAICSLSPYFNTPTGSITQQATKNYAFLMADRRELDKLRAGVAAYYLAQAYDNATVLAKQAYWQDALNAAISGSVVSTWKVLTDMKAALSTGTAITEQFLRYGRASGGNVLDPETGLYKPANIYYASWAVSNHDSASLGFGYNWNDSMNVDNETGSIVFQNPNDWATFTSTYDIMSIIGPSGTYTWDLDQAVGWTGGFYIPMTSSPDLANLDAVKALIDELYAQTYDASAQTWILRFATDAAAANEDESVLDLVIENLGGHIIKYPRYGVSNPPTPSTIYNN